MTNGISDRRVDEVLGLVGLENVADRTAGAFSLGMGQRLGIASALLGDPHTIMLDEPVNGLDPEGILWIRHLLSDLARQGRTVFVSSHLMSEMALMAEHFVIIGRGKLIADVTSTELEAMATGQHVQVRSPDADQLRAALTRDGMTVGDGPNGSLTVTGLTSDEVGWAAHAEGIVILELTQHHTTLEQTFMQLTSDSVDYHSHSGKAA